MGYAELQKIVAGLVRIGTVTDIDKAKRLARVKFQSEDYTSGWLQVVQQDKSSTYWMPKINDTVLCLYLPVFNADGFILGGL